MQEHPTELKTNIASLATYVHISLNCTSTHFPELRDIQNQLRCAVSSDESVAINHT